jgi:NAD+ diphosphatase
VNDDSIYQNYKPATIAPGNLEQDAYWFAFAGDQMLVHRDKGNALIHCRDLADIGIKPVRHQYLGSYDNVPCFSAELDSEIEAPDGTTLMSLRKLFTLVDEPLFILSGRAKQIMDWDRDHQFCGRCASPTDTRYEDRAKICPNCKLTAFPRLAPAVIVAVSRGEEILLARSNRFAAGWYSVLAGFVEPGETLEETVQREVMEEVGIQVNNIRYFGSQPWPFPHSLMIGFTADYSGGDIVVDDVEIEDAHWFHPDNLPNLPSRVSIARKLVDHFLASR